MPPIAPRRSWPQRRARSRCSTATHIWPADTSRACDEDIRDGIARARHPQCAADVDRAHRHHFAVGRQCLVRASSRCSPSPIPAKCCSPTAAKREEAVERLCLSRCSARSGERRAAARLFRHAPRPDAGGPSGGAGGGAELHRQRDLQDHQRAGERSRSRHSKTSISQAYRAAAARAAPPIAPTT